MKTREKEEREREKLYILITSNPLRKENKIGVPELYETDANR